MIREKKYSFHTSLEFIYLDYTLPFRYLSSVPICLVTDPGMESKKQDASIRFENLGYKFSQSVSENKYFYKTIFKRYIVRGQLKPYKTKT